MRSSYQRYLTGTVPVCPLGYVEQQIKKKELELMKSSKAERSKSYVTAERIRKDLTQTEYRSSLWRDLPSPAPYTHRWSEELHDLLWELWTESLRQNLGVNLDFVGNSGKHKLVTSVDILGGNVSDEVIEATIERARKSGKPVAVAQAIDEEEKAKKERDERKLAEVARRERLVAKAKYAVSLIDPFDVLQVKPVKIRGWDQDKDLSEKQRNALRRFGMDPDKVLKEKGYTNARNLLDACFARIEKHLCTFGQAKVLKRFGYSADLTFEEASKTIDALAKNKWRKIPGAPTQPPISEPAKPNRPPPQKPKPAPAKPLDFSNPYDDDVPF